jgi:hypothetical protein
MFRSRIGTALLIFFTMGFALRGNDQCTGNLNTKLQNCLPHFEGLDKCEAQLMYYPFSAYYPLSYLSYPYYPGASSPFSYYFWGKRKRSAPAANNEKEQQQKQQQQLKFM